jgi:hypothetical protein
MSKPEDEDTLNRPYLQDVPFQSLQGAAKQLKPELSENENMGHPLFT